MNKTAGAILEIATIVTAAAIYYLCFMHEDISAIIFKLLDIRHLAYVASPEFFFGSQYPPLFYKLFYFVKEQFGYSPENVFAYTSILAIIEITICYYLGKKLAGISAGIFCAFMAAFSPITAKVSAFFVPDNLAIVFLTLFYLACLHTKCFNINNKWAFIAASFFFGLALNTKENIIFYSFVFLAACLLKNLYLLKIKNLLSAPPLCTAIIITSLYVTGKYDDKIFYYTELASIVILIISFILFKNKNPQTALGALYLQIIIIMAAPYYLHHPNLSEGNLHSYLRWSEQTYKYQIYTFTIVKNFFLNLIPFTALLFPLSAIYIISLFKSGKKHKKSNDNEFDSIKYFSIVILIQLLSGHIVNMALKVYEWRFYYYIVPLQAVFCSLWLANNNQKRNIGLVLKYGAALLIMESTLTLMTNSYWEHLRCDKYMSEYISFNNNTINNQPSSSAAITIFMQAIPSESHSNNNFIGLIIYPDNNAKVKTSKLLNIDPCIFMELLKMKKLHTCECETNDIWDKISNLREANLTIKYFIIFEELSKPKEIDNLMIGLQKINMPTKKLRTLETLNHEYKIHIYCNTSAISQ